MRLEELRLGNLVKIDESDTSFEVNGINTYALSIKDQTEDVWIKHDSFLPILLTEKWLLKFGFEKVIYESDETGYSNDYELEIKGVGCISYSDDFSCALFGSKESSKDELGFLPNWDNCKHVHSLQNLYFALTGEELKIKE
jgi:hypothetical protein